MFSLFKKSKEEIKEDILKKLTTAEGLFRADRKIKDRIRVLMWFRRKYTKLVLKEMSFYDAEELNELNIHLTAAISYYRNKETEKLNQQFMIIKQFLRDMLRKYKSM